MKKILHLTLSKKPFEVMVTGEKNVEYREPTDWIISRIEGKEYDVVKLVNGYGADKPYFIAEYKGWRQAGIFKERTYSNGLFVDIDPLTICIYLGKIIETGNLK